MYVFNKIVLRYIDFTIYNKDTYEDILLKIIMYHPTRPLDTLITPLHIRRKKENVENGFFHHFCHRVQLEIVYKEQIGSVYVITDSFSSASSHETSFIRLHQFRANEQSTRQ